MITNMLSLFHMNICVEVCLLYGIFHVIWYGNELVIVVCCLKWLWNDIGTVLGEEKREAERPLKTAQNQAVSRPGQARQARGCWPGSGRG